MTHYIKQDKPFKVPATDGKLIEEHFGLASTGQSNFSIAHMIAPAGWSEPFQTPQFDEVTIMIRGKKQIETGDQTIVLSAGESLLVSKGSRVRYSNPFEEETEYWSVCLPSFSLNTVNREQ